MLSSTRTFISESGLLGKNARAMYSLVSIGSTGNSTALFDVVQLES